MKRDIAARNPVPAAPVPSTMPTAGPALPGASGIISVNHLSSPLAPAPVLSIPQQPIAHGLAFPPPPPLLHVQQSHQQSQFAAPAPVPADTARPAAPPPPHHILPLALAMPEISVSYDHITAYAAPSAVSEESATKRPRVTEQGLLMLIYYCFK